MPQDVQTPPQTTVVTGAASAATDPADQHLAHLHKMSTTAGVTNQDYVAVNPLAVVAAVLGLASALAFVGWPLLVVPVVGAIFAIVAYRQVSDSNGTQTGKGLAMLGLALCILCTVGVVARTLMQRAAVRADEQGVADVIADVERHLKAGDYAAAYQNFDPDFRKQFSADVFAKRWEAFQNPAYLGKLQVFQWNGVSPVFQAAGGTRVATTVAKVKFERGAEERSDVQLRKIDDKWHIAGLPQYFEPPNRRQQQQEDNFNLD